MAEAAVNLVVEHLIPFLIEEAKLLKGVRGEVEFIKDEMDSLRVLLKDADAKAEIDEDVKIWVKQLRQVAFRMEDVMDEFRLRVAQQHLGSGAAGWVCKTFGCVKSLKPRHMVATEIQDIKEKPIQISEWKERHKFKSMVLESDVASSSSSSRAVAASWRDINAFYADEVELVGIEKSRNRQLVSWLVQGPENRSMFTVVGTGGVGKTTLVRKVFKNDQVKSRFQYQTWITVSQLFKIEDLLVELINQFHESRKESFSPAKVERTYLTEILRNYLQDERYVAILDDVWSVELWDFLKHALLDNHCGSRVIVIMRTNDVAFSFVQSSMHVFHLDPLPLEDALVLFYKMAFGTDFKGKCPPELSKDIVKRSLPTKLKTIMKIISLSYYDLPYHLKSCFLYFGIIPEDFVYPSISWSDIVMDSGRICEEEKGKTLEEVAEDYLDQLISWNLVQVDKFEFGYVLRCKVHDLMREFILARFIEENFCEVFFYGKSTSSSYVTNQRLSIQYNTTGAENVMNRENSYSLVRSFT